jgi:hypothetical protein
MYTEYYMALQAAESTPLAIRNLAMGGFLRDLVEDFP